MKSLNTDSLKIGDIILTTASSKVSKAVRLGTDSDISHAMVYVEDHSVIDATGDGVQGRNTQRQLFEDDSPVYVLRLRDGLPESQARDICNFVRAQIGTEYSTKEALKTILGGGRGWTRKQFCSRLVAQAYASAGIALVDDPNFCSPADLKNSPLLIRVEAVTVSITAQEAAQWEGLVDMPQMMMDATNRVLSGARTIDKDIQNLNDLDRHLIENPADDEYLCELLEQSGYLSLWQAEKDQNPWQYDIKLLNAFSSVEPRIDQYCRHVLANELQGPSRYIVNRGGYAQLARQFCLRYFHLKRGLYDILANLHQMRVQTATAWLEAKYFPGTAGMPSSYLVPHTSEWFAALEVWDPPQAAMTRMAVATVGSIDVCSICGDDPARDYRLEEPFRPPAGVDTLRLCDDCVEIRRRMGDPFVPFPTVSPDAP